MNDKQAALSIILRTVDKATAGIVAVNKRLDQLTKPTRDFGKALKELGDKSGFDSVVGGFREVGSAVSAIMGKLLLAGGILAGATAGVLSLIDHFDKLGDTAERMGTSADFLAAMRYAAERAGTSVEALDSGLQTLTQNMGQAKAGTGRMLKFLNQISPVLAHQVTAANSMEEALGLLADASAKLPDAARRAALAQKTLGDASLAPLLARGSAGIQELLTRYYELAGAQGDAAEAAGKTDDALKDLHASADGVKAALVRGLSPALTTIINKLTQWLVDHRPDIERWAEDIGRRLPGAVDDLVRSVKGAAQGVMTFVDAIGGWKVAGVALAAVIAGPLISSIVSLGIALTATPFGLVVLGLAGISASVLLLTSQIRDLYELMDTSHEKLTEDVARLNSGELTARQFEIRHPGFLADAAKQTSLSESLGLEKPRSIVEVPRFDVLSQYPVLQRMLEPPAWQRPFGAETAQQPAGKITVQFQNAPRGMRVTAEPRLAASVDLGVGYQMGGMP